MDKKPTDTQNEILNTEGKFIVRACPGSGKTFTVALKMAEILTKWPYHHQGIAAISFTNVAWKEVELELKETFRIDVPINYPHFLGTIDSFINNFIFFPYGHLVLECDKKPILVGEPVFPWKFKRFERDHYQYFDKVSYNIEGDIVPITSRNNFHFKWKKFNQDNSLDGNFIKIKEMKENLKGKGLVNQSDVDYFSMKLLENYPSIAKTIVLRFPNIFIDESQDTSEIQMRIFELLVENGLEEIILIGDPDQSIFEWNGAKPELFEKKIQEWNKDITMNENWRSSQNICDFTYKMSDLSEKSISINEDRDYHHKPEIWSYDHTNPDFESLISQFLELCDSEGIKLDSKNIAILSRSNNLIEQIVLNCNHKKSVKKINPWKNNYAEQLMRSKYLYDLKEVQESFELLERTYMSLLKGKTIYSDYELSNLINEFGYFNFKKEVFGLISLMPNTDKTLNEWIDEFKRTIDPKINLKIDLSINDEFGDLFFDDVFGYNNFRKDYNLSTIHKVKGETFEAVLLIIKKKSANNKNYKTMLNNNQKTKDNEELRNIYVGITRPKKILVLAVPNDDKEYWDNYFFKKDTQKSLFDFQ